MKAVVISYQGTGRESQEDNFFLYPDQLLVDGSSVKKTDCYLKLEKRYKNRHGIFAVADGMGGYEHGEVASRDAVSYLKKNAEMLLDMAEMYETSADDMHVVLQYCLEQMNHIICCRKKELLQKRMGTTLAAAVLSESKVFSMAVGDSRIYRYNPKIQLSQITTDQNQETRMRKLGFLNEGEYTQNPYGKALYQYLGMERNEMQVSAQFREWDISEAGEWILITTDGLTDELTQMEISAALQKYYDADCVSGAAEELLKRAVASASVRRHGTDNITLILISFMNENRLKAPEKVLQEEMSMDFFGHIGKKVTEKSQEAINYGRSVADTVKLNSAISEEEKKIEILYKQIGKKYVDKFYGNYDEIFREELLQIKSSLELIQTCREQINELKGTQICERCGSEVPKGSLFCSTCGNKMPEPKSAASTGTVQSCPVCGAVIHEGDLFCMGCGNKVAVPEQKIPETEPNNNANGNKDDSGFCACGRETESDSETVTTEGKLPGICKNCGAPLGENDIFCVNCGTRTD